MRRFFFDNSARQGNEVCLSEQESRHIVKVLRLKEGTAVELLDGTGKIYLAKISAVDKKVWLQLENLLDDQSRESSRKLILGQAILKGQKMDELVQRCTELGVTQFCPFWSSRCQGKFDQQRQQEKLSRFYRISEAACKQSSRRIPMDFAPPATFESFVTAGTFPEDFQKFLLWEEEGSTNLHTIDITSSAGVVLLLGPEGGFSRAEADAARGNGWQSVSLGKTILRAETATLAEVSILQYLLGNI